jgi:hypothetical protein
VCHTGRTGAASYGKSYVRFGGPACSSARAVVTVVIVVTVVTVVIAPPRHDPG